MAGPRNNTLIRDGSSDLTATVTLQFGTTTSDIPAGPQLVRNLGFYCNVPAAPTGTSPTLKLLVRSKTAGKKVEVTHTDNIIAKGLYVLPLPMSDDADWEVVATVGGTTPNFGAVQMWLEATQVAKVP